jgi:hypothetical protein
LGWLGLGAPGHAMGFWKAFFRLFVGSSGIWAGKGALGKAKGTNCLFVIPTGVYFGCKWGKHLEFFITLDTSDVHDKMQRGQGK